MGHRFKKHYTREEARSLLPQVRQWLETLSQLRTRVSECGERLNVLMTGGNDVGGDVVHQWVRAWADSKQTLREFERREIQIKDLNRGLIDFPAIIGGREVFLCWEQDEEDIEFWHDLESGYAG